MGSSAGPLWLFYFLSSLNWERSGLETEFFQCQGRLKIDATVSPITRNTTGSVISNPVLCSSSQVGHDALHSTNWRNCDCW